MRILGVAYFEKSGCLWDRLKKWLPETISHLLTLSYLKENLKTEILKYKNKTTKSEPQGVYKMCIKWQTKVLNRSEATF